MLYEGGSRAGGKPRVEAPAKMWGARIGGWGAVGGQTPCPRMPLVQFCFFLTFYFILGYNRLTVLWWFQVNSEGTQPYVCIYLFSSKRPWSSFLAGCFLPRDCLSMWLTGASLPFSAVLGNKLDFSQFSPNLCHGVPHLLHLNYSEAFYYQLEMRERIVVGEGIKDNLWKRNLEIGGIAISGGRGP